ncbi:15213_t:CDS:2 [Racocetra persica]|uniref:15213_t:CDS:1 n=1 Tax=Racocetra persica TaxID=160502 RepID=A0ACA9MZX7_9GLOM|nr:15213_t:CDS:2 [Racocetra persica]
MYVYKECRDRGEYMKLKCAPMDYNCQCDAVKAIQLCFLQCADDINITNEGKALEPSVAQICAYSTPVNPTSSTPISPDKNSIPTTQKSLPETQNNSPIRNATTPTVASTVAPTASSNVKNSSNSLKRCWNNLIIVCGVISFGFIVV